MGTCCHALILSAASKLRFSRASATQRKSGAGWRQSLRAQHLPQEATAADATRYGQKYEIRATLVGPANRSAGVVSVWIVRAGENVPRFVTAYPEG